MEQRQSAVGLCEKPVFLNQKTPENNKWTVDVPPNKSSNHSCQDVSLNSTFTTVKSVVDENEELNTKYNQLVQQSKRVSEKSVLYDRKVRRLQKLSILTRNKVKRLRQLETVAKKEPDLVSEVFSPAQINILLGRTRVKWSHDDIARAFTLRHIGGKDCYLYLKNTLNIPLPSLSCVQRWAASDV